MSVQYTPYALLSLASAAVLAALAGFAWWRRRDAPAAEAFAALMLAGSWWKLFYAVDLASAGLGAKLFWAKAEYLGVVAVPVAWLALALGYAGVGEAGARRRALILLSLLPLATLAIVWTNGANGAPHGLVWSSVALDGSGSFVALTVAYGPWYWVHVAYSYALLLAGTAVLVAGVARSSRSYYPQGLALLAGALLSWVANASYLWGVEPVPNLNPSVLVFPVTGALFALGLFRLRLLDLSPVARDAAFEASPDGLIVADSRGRVADLNPAAERILGGPARRLLGTSISGLIPARPAPLDATHSVGESDHREVSLGDGREGASRRYELTEAPLEDRGGQRVGRLLSLRDVTERKRTEEALRRSEERFRSILRYSSDVIMTLDADATIRYQSQAVERVLGYRPEELVGESAFGYLHPDDAERVSKQFGRILEDSGLHGPVEYRFRHADGSWRWLEAVGTNLLSDPSVGGIVVNSRDVTERKRAEKALRLRDRAIAESKDGVVITGPGEQDHPMVYVNRGFERMTGYAAEELLGRNCRMMQGRETDRPVLGGLRAALGEGREWSGVLRNHRKDGAPFWNELSVSPVRDDGGRVTHFVGVMKDVTERKELEKRLEHQALHDGLTGLPNRALLQDRLGHALARAERGGGEVAVLFVDLDNFKYVNDSLGHEKGDGLLVAVADRLKECLRPGDTAARLGGDEFAVLLEGVGGLGEAERVAGRIVEVMRSPFALGGGQEVFATPSIGIATGGGPGGGDAPEDLLRRADLAMYRAKGEGKARYEVFEESMEAATLKRLKLENDLRRALERDEFVVRYQPVVRLSTGRIAGFEALVRWEHPERGLVLPEEFVPLTEETGLIIPIGAWVLEEACRQAKGWRAQRPADPPPVVGVNLSARQLSHPGLVGDVEKALDESGLEPGRLTLEITEGAVVGNAERCADALRGLRGIGVRLALDDFGTGYSSLSYLRRLPVGMLKIDRSFVERLGRDPEDEVLLSGVVGIAHGLGLLVCAEGVETPEQSARAKALGCDLAQGNLFSAPLTGEEASRVLSEP